MQSNAGVNMNAINDSYYVIQKVESDPREVIEETSSHVPYSVNKMLFPVTVKLQRTVSMPNSDGESARISVGVTSFCDDHDADKVYDNTLDLVRSWLNHEVSSLTGKQHKRPEFKLDNVPFAIVTIDYGVTKNTGNFKFSKADVGRSIPVTDMTKLPERIEYLEKWMEQKIQERVDAIKSIIRKRN